MDKNAQSPTLAWVKWFDDRMEEAFGLLGGELGNRERQVRDELLKAINAEHSTNRRRLDQQRDDLAELLKGHRETIAAMGRTIANQEARLQSVEAMFAQPAQTMAADRRRLS